MKTFNFFLLLFFCFTDFSFAASRTVHFTAVARNTTTQGLSEAATGCNCVITVSNPSSVSQTYQLDISSSTGSVGSTAALNGSYTKSSGPALGASKSLAANATDIYVLDFNANYPASPTVGAGYQNLTCAGSILVSDPSAGNPGFIVATGTLTSFTEAGGLHTEGTTGDAQFKGFAVYSQSPVFINQGKPF
ncbi:MAG: hypothetical protein M9962_05065 [Oligoflexia bacterium]|nr:hypothetical protein [Oligoflexia bacterium]